eukprot:TRINITY_DN55790_c0_g1_i1.p1 TRINITY_DN55790_c0_g1~~TRINITY_DN55790_c0_g1_i1.p1  ORF type:complete len:451 (+),score=104.53 TRINITY_DN55790_c0_g1_i1:111-1463(+)
MKYVAALFASLCMARVVVGNVPIILDDSDSSGVQTEHTVVGKCPCLSGGYNGHHHTAKGWNRDKAYMTYTFTVPQDGCYKLEEHHPKAIEGKCASAMPTNARLDVDWCRGRSSTIYIDQSQKSSQWNTIGHFPFYTSQPGRLKLSASSGQQCQRGTKCFWVADAFRVTYVGARCNDHTIAAASTAVTSQQQMSTTTVAAFPTNPPPVDVFPMEKGVLRLKLSLGLGAYQESSIEAVLTKHKMMLEKLFKKMFDAFDVVIDSIKEWEGQGRRLKSSGLSQFEIRFRAQLDSVAQPSSTEMTASLSQAFFSVGSGLQVHDATIAWPELKTPTETTAEKENESGFSPTTLIVLILTGVMALGIVIASVKLVCGSSKKAENEEKELEVIDHGDLTSAPEDGAKDVEKAEEKEDKEAEIVDDNASTITPCSDENRSNPEKEEDQDIAPAAIQVEL